MGSKKSDLCAPFQAIGGSPGGKGLRALFWEKLLLAAGESLEKEAALGSWNEQTCYQLGISVG